MNVVSIVYAYKPEVRVLKALLKQNDLASQVRWYKWPSFPRKRQDLILNIGFCGGLSPNLALGQVVLVNKVITEEKKAIALNGINQSLAKNFAKSRNIPLATLLTVHNAITNSVLRDELRQKTNADIVDMEGYNLFATFPRKWQMSVVIFKVVSDNADSDTLLNIKQKGELWSKILAQTVVEFLKWSEVNKSKSQTAKG